MDGNHWLAPLWNFHDELFVRCKAYTVHALLKESR
jgi:hypothetical protein